MKRIQMAGMLCACILLSSAVTWAQKRKFVVIDADPNDGAKCQIKTPGMRLSHDHNKDERVHWVAAKYSGTYVVSFKGDSPCYTGNSLNSAKVFVYLVGDGSQSDACVAPDFVPPGMYDYSVFRRNAGGSLTKCNDPAVIVTDGRALQVEMRKATPEQYEKANIERETKSQPIPTPVQIGRTCEIVDGYEVTLYQSTHDPMKWWSERTGFTITFDGSAPYACEEGQTFSDNDTGETDVCHVNQNLKPDPSGPPLKFTYKISRTDAGACSGDGIVYVAK